MAPGQPATFDVALDQLMPGVMRVGRFAVAEDAEVNHEADAGFDRRVHDRLNLMHHVDRVACHDEQAVGAAQGGGKASRIVQVEDGRGLVFGLPCSRLTDVAGRSHDVQVRIRLEIAQHGAANTAG